MNVLDRLQNFLRNLDEKDFFKYLLIFLATVFFILGLMFYLHYSRVSAYSSKLNNINKQREKTKKILSDYKLVIQQKAKVEEILEKSRDFFIAQEWDDILGKLNLKKYQTEEPSRTEGETISGKIERKLKARLDGINTKQLVDLLQEIAETERLYPKDLSIKKSPKAKLIDVDLEIATLEPIQAV